MYFTNTPSLNSMETMMRVAPHSRQRGGGRNRSPYKYTKEDCDCRFCLYYRKKEGCSVSICPVIDIRLECGAASFYEAVKMTFSEVKHIPFQRRLQKIYNSEDGGFMIYQNALHKKIFETERMNLPKMNNRTVAALYLLIADSALWRKTKGTIRTDKINLSDAHIGPMSPDSYAIWKAVKEIQTGKRQITLCELSDREIISDRAFRLIVQALTIARFGTAVLKGADEV